MSIVETTSSDNSNDSIIVSRKRRVAEVGALACRGNCGETLGNAEESGTWGVWERELNHCDEDIMARRHCCLAVVGPFCSAIIHHGFVGLLLHTSSAL